mgnify:CR=1 FL=1
MMNYDFPFFFLSFFRVLFPCHFSVSLFRVIPLNYRVLLSISRCLWHELHNPKEKLREIIFLTLVNFSPGHTAHVPVLRCSGGSLSGGSDCVADLFLLRIRVSDGSLSGGSVPADAVWRIGSGPDRTFYTCSAPPLRICTFQVDFFLFRTIRSV